MQENKLADGNIFEFWEKDVNYIHTLYVACDASNASDDNDGSITAPLKTIQAAADRAEPGTHILIAPGTYRECVSPKKGGDSPESMICYEAQEPGTVIIKASEEIHEFEKSEGWRLWGYGAPNVTVKVRLTRTEYAILKLLLQNPEQVVAKLTILENISLDTPDCTEDSLKIHIHNLRKKLKDTIGKDMIKAIWGIGFMITSKS